MKISYFNRVGGVFVVVVAAVSVVVNVAVVVVAFAMKCVHLLLLVLPILVQFHQFGAMLKLQKVGPLERLPYSTQVSPKAEIR